jgi:hypothetical protein
MPAQFIPLKGRKFGQLKVLRAATTDEKKSGTKKCWYCECACGKKLVIRGIALRQGQKSCGCLCTLPPGRANRNMVYGQYLLGAKTRGLIWSLSERTFDTLTKMLCHYCGNPPTNSYSTRDCNGPFIYNGLDRKNSRLGYTIRNVVPCCKICQKAKGNMPYQQFIDLLMRGAAHQGIIRAGG